MKASQVSVLDLGEAHRLRAASVAAGAEVTCTEGKDTGAERCGLWPPQGVRGPAPAQAPTRTCLRALFLAYSGSLLLSSCGLPRLAAPMSSGESFPAPIFQGHPMRWSPGLDLRPDESHGCLKLGCTACVGDPQEVL